ncbi:MAG: O-antigen ligase family protein [Planctomycetaceae bacterium]|jgi:hypothetical protein|nr:O-antigen ligase family protein [Planctomycetaceae bacterium]
MIGCIVGYMWLFLHRPFEVWYWLGALHIERVYMLIVLVMWFALASKQLLENRVNIAIGLFAFSMLFSTMMSPYTNVFDNISFQSWMKYLVFYGLVMTSVKSERDLKIVVTCLVGCFFIYMLHSYREFLNGRYVYAMGTVRMIGVDSTMGSPNSYGASIVIFLPMLLPLFQLVKTKWHVLFVISYILLSLRCVQLTGSRSSFLALGLALSVWILFSKHRLKLIPLAVLCSPLLWVLLPDNLKDRYRTIWDPTVNESANASAEGRLIGFWDGLTNWQSSPVWGVGPDCHGMAIGNGFLSHFLYGQIPGELGTIGVIAFLMLLFCYAANHFEIVNCYNYMKKRGYAKECEYCYAVSIATLGSVGLMLFLGLSGHNGYRFTWIWIAGFQAIALSIIKEKMTKIQQQEFYQKLVNNYSLAS